MSAFFGNRAPELVPEIVNDLNIHPALRRKLPLREKSQSDLNAAANKPTVRILKDDNKTVRLLMEDNDSSSIYQKSPLADKGSHTLKSSRTRDGIYVDVPKANARPMSLDGGYTVAANRSAPLSKKSQRFSASTTTSAADTLVADSLFTPTSQRFSVDQLKIANSMAEHLEPLQELSSEAVMPITSDVDIPDRSSIPAMPLRPWHMAHSSSCYSSSAWDEVRPPTPPRSATRSAAVSPADEKPEERTFESARHPSEESVTESVSPQERGTPHLIRYVASIDSVRPQYAAVRRPVKQAASMNSLWSTDSGEAESLHVPRKRAYAGAGTMSSHPSLLLESPSLPAFTSEAAIVRRPRAATSSSYSDSMVSPLAHRTIKPSSSYASIGAALRSNDSAVPEPLFMSSVPLPQMPFEPSSNHYSTELDDTICELQTAPLREKRSGYIRRRRSIGELRLNHKRSNQSMAESDRWSTGTVIFPQWAKFFYAGKSGLQSTYPSHVTLAGPAYGHDAQRSMVTLAGPAYSSMNVSTRSIDQPFSFDLPRTIRHQPSRADTLFSYVSRPESSHSNWETIYTESPSPGQSEYFRGRPRSYTDIRFVTPEGSSRPPTRHRHRMSLPLFAHPARPDFDSEYVTESESESAMEDDDDEIMPVPSNRLSRHISVKESIKSGIAAVKKSRRTSTIPGSPERQPDAGPKAARGRSFPSIPRLVTNSRLVRNLSAWRVPSIDEPFPTEVLGYGNRQIVCFCLGFILPPLWILAAFLAVQAPKDGPREKTAADVEQQWTWEDERKVLKARWWRNLNRGMSLLGVAIMAVIITLAVLASRG